MTPDSEMEPVVQSDRDAAADLYLDLEGLPYSPRDLARADEHRRGEYDAHASVQGLRPPPDRSGCSGDRAGVRQTGDPEQDARQSTTCAEAGQSTWA